MLLMGTDCLEREMGGRSVLGREKNVPFSFRKSLVIIIFFYNKHMELFLLNKAESNLMLVSPC